MHIGRLITVSAVAVTLFGLATLGAVSAAGPEDPEPRGWLGVQLKESSAEVSSVIPGSPADGTLQAGDTLLEVSGESIDSLRGLRHALTGHAPDDRIDVVVQRGDSRKTLEVVLGAVPSPAELTEAQLKGRTLPEFSVHLMPSVSNGHGETFSNSSLGGRFTLIEFWATWCPPCEETRAFLTDLKQTHGSSLQILAVSPESADTIQRVVTEEKVPYLVGRDPGGATQKAFGVGQLPTIVAVASDGTVVEVFVGAEHQQAIRALTEQRLE